KNGTPLMRPLFFEDGNQELESYSQAYLWGDDFLVSPVLELGAQTQDVYFPEGSNWFDFYTGEKYKGGSTQTISVLEDHILTFVRGGSIIPMANPMQSTKEYNGNVIQLHYYFDKDEDETDYELYNDDGTLSNAFENGHYEILEFEAELDKHWLELDFEAELGEQYGPSTKRIELILHNIQKAPKKLKIDRKRTPIEYNSDKKTVHIPLTWNTNKKKTITLKLKP